MLMASLLLPMFFVVAGVGVLSEAVDMNGRFQMQGGKNWILPK
jgi:hypothetical protein